MATIYNKSMSLIEQKKLQWAREREELAGLGGLWGQNSRNIERSCIKTQFLSAIDINDLQPLNNCNGSSSTSKPYNTMFGEGHRQRSPSLPPIPRSCYEVTQSFRESLYNVEDETSGYASDSAPHSTPEYDKKSILEKQTNFVSQQENRESFNRSYGTPESFDSGSRRCSNGDERAKWGDRGIGVGHLWEPSPHKPQSRLPQVAPTGSPNWLERELNKMQESSRSQVLMLHHVTDLPLNGSQDDVDPLADVSCRTYIRGQNVRVEPDELAERESKRSKAVQLQEAIKQQLEEREIQRRAEKQKRIREEQMEEERIQKQQEQEKKRLDEERRLIKDREEKERIKAEQMIKAIQDAEYQAKLCKQNERRNKQQIAEQSIEGQSENSVVVNEENMKEESKETMLIGSPIKLRKDIEKNQNSNERIDETSKEPDVSKQADGVALILQSVSPVFMENQLGMLSLPVAHEVLTPIAIHGGMQLAFLLPQTQAKSQMHSVSCGESSPRIDNRILTPTKYRQLRESSTQTDPIPEDNIRYIEQPKDIKYEYTQKKLRYRNDVKDNRLLNLEERPKWGVNQPPTQYLKQSEKDPFYNQKRRQRQKVRRNYDKQNDDTWSSDDTRSSSPEIGYWETRTQFYRKADKMRSTKPRERNPGNNTVTKNYCIQKTEIVPLESDEFGVYQMNTNDGLDKHTLDVIQGSHKVKHIRKSFSEKFITAKYEKIKLENSDNARINTGRSSNKSRPESKDVMMSARRKELINETNEERKLMMDNEDKDAAWPGNEVLHQITKMRDGLIRKKQSWTANSRDSNLGPRLVDIEYS